MKRSTLKEVAELAGVSTATVSNALNGKKNVSGDTKKKIDQAIKELNYRPNILAKSLRVKSSRIIGVLISDITNPFFSNIVSGIEEELAQSHYSILLCNTNSTVTKERKYLEMLIEQRVDGLIISSSGNTGEYFRTLTKTGIPLVFLNRIPNHLDSDIIVTNNIQGGYTATEHLIKHGYKKIAIIAGPQSISTGKDRLIGYLRALEDYCIEQSDNFIKVGSFDIQSGYEKMRELMEQTEKPDAVFVSNNSMTMGAYKYLKKAKIDIPNQVAVVGFDDSDWSDIVDPPVTTIQQPANQLGIEAAKVILSRIKKTPIKCGIVYKDTTLLIRQSCGCVNE